MASLDYKSKKNNAKHIFPLIYLFFKKKITKHLIMKCMNAMECGMQILKIKKKIKKKKHKRMITKSRDMKHKDHVKKTQLD